MTDISVTITYCILIIFRIKPVEAMALTRESNVGITKNLPPDWFKRLRSYVMEDRQIEELRTAGAKVEEVTLKDSEKEGYYVRPAQLMARKKFASGTSMLPILAWPLLKNKNSFYKV